MGISKYLKIIKFRKRKDNCVACIRSKKDRLSHTKKRGKGMLEWESTGHVQESVN